MARRWILAAQTLASLTGLAVAVWAHLFSMLGGNPGIRFKAIWIVQLGLLCLLLPIAFEIFRRRNFTDICHPNRCLRLILYGLLVYYGIHFYVFVFVAAEHLSSQATWRMFSAGWMLLFAFSAVFYWLHLQDVTAAARGEINPTETPVR